MQTVGATNSVRLFLYYFTKPKQTGRNFRFVKQIADIVSEENLLPTLALSSVNARWELSFKKVRSFICCGLLNTIKKAGKIPTLNF